MNTEINIVDDHTDYEGDISSESDDESISEDDNIFLKNHILLQALTFKTKYCLEFLENKDKIITKKEYNNLLLEILDRSKIYKRILAGKYFNNINFNVDEDIIKLSYCKNIFRKYGKPSDSFPYLGYKCDCIHCNL